MKNNKKSAHVPTATTWSRKNIHSQIKLRFHDQPKQTFTNFADKMGIITL